MFTRSVINGMAQAGSKLPDLFQGAKQEVGRKTSQRQLPNGTTVFFPKVAFPATGAGRGSTASRPDCEGRA